MTGTTRTNTPKRHKSVRNTPEQKLWQHVLLAVLADLQTTSVHNRSRREDAIAWIGGFPSRDFRAVCDLAGIEPKQTHIYFQRISAAVNEVENGSKTQTIPQAPGSLNSEPEYDSCGEYNG
ncbi:hypothetical protein GKC28_04580 [Leisingera sp. ANG59]|nr:hypothetical protein [Leisingera sp. ANG59]